MQELTLNSAALWNAQQTFFEYMADTGRSHLAEQIRTQLTPVEKHDNLRLSINCMVQDVDLMRTVAKEPHLSVQMVARNKATMLPLFAALRSWQSRFGSGQIGMPIPLCLFIQLCARFWGLNNQIAQFRVAQAKGCLEVSLEPSVLSSFNSTIAEGIATGMVMAVRDYLQVLPKSIAFPHEKLTDYQEDQYIKVLGVAPKFSHHGIIICFEDEDYDFELTEQVISMLSHFNSMHSVQFPEIDITQRTQWVMELLLPITEPTKCVVSQILNTSVSTLDRRLKSQKTSFKLILLQLKKQLAVEYLITFNKSASKTSNLLGYTSTAQFFKAFKKWFGQTPNQFKASLVTL